MRVLKLHRWDVNEKEAIEIQEKLKEKLILKPYEGKIEKIGGVDCSYKNDKIYVGFVVCKFPSLEIINQYYLIRKVNFPYIPGLFAFREAPAIVELFEKVKEEPDLIIINGHGIAHPRKVGIASHIGILIEKPTIGCAEKILYGTYSEPPSFSLSSTFIKDKEGEIIGHAVRNYQGKIIFVSPGNLIDLRQTLSITLQSLKENFSLPVPLSLAHRLSGELLRNSC
ncbi:endonuclease V [bacterium]|nr:endonuclease V [bacterium]